MRSITSRIGLGMTAVASLVVTMAIVTAPQAAACDALQEANCVVVSAGSPGEPVSGGEVQPGSGDGSSDAPTSDVDAAQQSDVSGAANGSSTAGGSADPGTCAELEARYAGADPAALKAALALASCAEGEMASTGAAAVPVAPSPGVLAVEAADSFVLPSPVLGRFPSGLLADGRPYTVVGTHVWFWTDPGAWKPLTATANARGNWARVTATPTVLSFTPGDGAAAVSCQGPGLVFDPQSSQDRLPNSWAPVAEPGGCDYVYPRSSGDFPDEEVTATLTITWQLTWTGSGNTSGTLTQRSVSSAARFVVAELQSVVTG